MTSLQKWMAYATSALLLLTGLAWLLLDRFGAVEGEFGPAKPPLQPWMLRVHGAAALAMVWILGGLWYTHVRPLLEAGRRRLSGAMLLAANVTLVVTGYLLYYVSSERLRAAVSLAHWGLGILAAVLLVAHARARRGRAEDGLEGGV